MIPLGLFTPVPISAAFLPPLDDAYDPLQMRAPGGVAIGSGSQGREVQPWTVKYAGGLITVIPTIPGVGLTLPVSGVLAVSLAFDANMAVAIGYSKADGCYLYFYNGSSNAYETLFVPGATSCRVCVDKTSGFYQGQSDVMFGYLQGGALYYRQQRDRYVTPYYVGPAAGTLTGAGPTVSNRLQFRVTSP